MSSNQTDFDTRVSLQKYVENLFTGMHELFDQGQLGQDQASVQRSILNDQRFKNIEENTKKAAELMDARLAGMNEFRKSLEDQAGRFLTRDIHDAAMTEIDRRLDAILERMSAQDIKQGLSEEHITALTARTASLSVKQSAEQVDHEKRIVLIERALPILHGVAYVATAVLIALLVAIATGKMHVGQGPS